MTATTAGLRSVLDQIRQDHGRLTPAIVLEVAADPEHLLHSRFTWDDDEAADRWRLSQARDLIRRCRVVARPGTDTQGPQTIRAYHSLPDEQGRAYQPAHEVAEDPVARRILLAEMERDWQTLKRRWQHFAEFADMVRRTLEDEAA